MSKFKRFLSILLVMVMILSLAACGNKNDKKDDGEKKVEENKENKEQKEKPADKPYAGKTLKVAGLDSGYGTGGWKAVVAKFEEQTGAKVELTLEKNIAEVVRPQIQAGNVPDVLYNNIGGEGGLTETLIKEKLILDISDVLAMNVLGEEKKVSEKILPGFLDTFMTKPYGDDKTYLMPLFYSPTGLWYNKAMFKDNGGKYELPKTFDDFFKLGEAAKADNVALFTYPTTGYFDSFMLSLFNEVGGPELFNKLMNYDVDAWKTEAKKAFEVVGKIAPFIEANTVAQANKEGFTKNQQAIIDNKALFMPNGTWIAGEMAKSTPEGYQWGYMALPELDSNHGRYAYTFFEQAFVLKDAAEPDLAKLFISYLYSDEAAKLFAAMYPTKDVDKDGKEIETEKGGAIQPVVGASQLNTDPLMKEVYTVYENGVKASIGNFAAAPAVEGVNINEVLYNTIDSVMNGSKTYEDWHNEVVSAVEKISAAMK